MPSFVINPLHTNLYRKGQSLRKTKTDKVDAASIAMMLLTDRTLKPYSDTSYHNEELKSLTRYRFDKVQERARLKTSVSRLVNILFPELEKLVPSLHMASVYTLLSEFPGASFISAAHLTRLKHLLHDASKGRYVVGEAELKAGISALCDSVAGRLRHAGKKCRTVQIGIRNPDFVTIQRQTTLDVPTFLKADLVRISMQLLRDNWDMTKPVRLLSVTGSELVDADEEVPVQLSLFGSDDTEAKEKTKDPEKQETIESTIDELRQKFGKGAITLGFNRLDR